MISIVICHRNPTFLHQLKQSVNSTIGVPFELVVIDNKANNYNIFQAYNLGVQKIIYDIICFAHEDIIFHTKDWGKKIIKHFENPKIGIIGVAGSHYIPKLPGAQWSSGITSSNIIHTINGETRHETIRYFNNNELSVKALLLDGVWLCISKDAMKKVRFDEDTFSGFHCYDADICTQLIKLNYEARIVFDINIEHFSFGSRNKTWLVNLFKFYNKWKNDLPIAVIELSKSKSDEANYKNARELIEIIRFNKLNILYILRVWLYYIRITRLTNKSNIMYCLSLIKRTFC